MGVWGSGVFMTLPRLGMFWGLSSGVFPWGFSGEEKSLCEGQHEDWGSMKPGLRELRRGAQLRRHSSLEIYEKSGLGGMT